MKVLICIGVVLLTVYGPAELTRYIIAYGLDAGLIFELVFMWLFYIAGMTLVIRRIR